MGQRNRIVHQIVSKLRVSHELPLDRVLANVSDGKNNVMMTNFAVYKVRRSDQPLLLIVSSSLLAVRLRWWSKRMKSLRQMAHEMPNPIIRFSYGIICPPSHPNITYEVISIRPNPVNIWRSRPVVLKLLMVKIKNDRFPPSSDQSKVRNIWHQNSK